MNGTLHVRRGDSLDAVRLNEDLAEALAIRDRACEYVNVLFNKMLRALPEWNIYAGSFEDSSQASDWPESDVTAFGNDEDEAIACWFWMTRQDPGDYQGVAAVKIKKEN